MKRLVVAEAPCGRIAGYERRGIRRFLGIPYGEAPSGALRLAAPRPKRPFERTFQAIHWGPAAMQRRVLPEPVARMTRQTVAFSEDCLNLHVFTPGLEGRRPVLVFLHGGGFVIGSGSQYPGDDLARRGDAVVVTLNYRLGLFGFNAFDQCFPGDERFAANAGLLDQHLALTWVRDNIAAFGGDPARVTLAGESAGAASTAFHLVNPGSRDLFHQAILQSGGLNLFYPKDHAGEVAQSVVERLGTVADPDRLLTLPPERFAAVMRMLAPHHSGIVSRPHVDGVHLPDKPLAELYAMAKPVPMLIGTNRDEFTMFSDLPMFPIDGRFPALCEWVRKGAGQAAAQRIAEIYSDTRRGRIDFGTDALFRIPAVHQAEIHAERAQTFLYRLDWEAKGYLGRLGATHSVDLPLIFDEFLKPFRSIYFGVLPDLQRAALSERMREHWMNFVNAGTPGGGWPPYQAPTRRTQVFGARDRLETAPDEARRMAWEGVHILTR